jgi:hypothetical protein
MHGYLLFSSLLVHESGDVFDCKTDMRVSRMEDGMDIAKSLSRSCWSRMWSWSSFCASSCDESSTLSVATTSFISISFNLQWGNM